MVAMRRGFFSPKSTTKPAQFRALPAPLLPTVRGVNPTRHPSLFATGLAHGAQALAAAVLAGLAAGLALPAAAMDESLEHSTRGLLTQAAAQLPQAGRAARVEVRLGQIDPRLSLAPCRRIEPYLPTGARPIGRTRVGLRCLETTTGQTPWNITVPVTVSLFAPAVVLRQALPAGTVLADEHLVFGEIDWGAEGRAFADVGPLIGRELGRPMAAGSTVQASDIKTRQWFASGETVQLVARGAGFSISAEGQALNPGIEGAPVRVKTGNGRVVTGRAIGDRQVEVML